MTNTTDTFGFVHLKTLQTALRNVMLFTSTDEDRAALTCVHIERKVTTLTVTAADGFRCYTETLSLWHSPLSTWAVTIPANQLRAVLKLKKSDADSVGMITFDIWEAGEREYTITSKSIYRGKPDTEQTYKCRNYGIDFGKIHTTATHAGFPDYHQIIPFCPKVRIGLSPLALGNVTSAMAKIAKSFGGTQVVKWYMNGQDQKDTHVFITESEEYGTARRESQSLEPLPYPPFGIAFSAPFLADVFKACGDRKISIGFTDRKSSVRFDVGDNTIIVLMPMWVDGLGWGCEVPEPPQNPESTPGAPLKWLHSSEDPTPGYSSGYQEHPQPNYADFDTETAPDMITDDLTEAELRVIHSEDGRNEWNTPAIVLHVIQPGAAMNKNLTTGFYTPSAAFRAIPEHCAVMDAETYELIAVTGRAIDEKSQADARLFAAAPDLLNALQISTTTLETVLKEYPHNIAAKVCIQRNREIEKRIQGE